MEESAEKLKMQNSGRLKLNQNKTKKSLLKRKERKMGSEIGLGLVLVGLGLEMLIGISARDPLSALLPMNISPPFKHVANQKTKTKTSKMRSLPINRSPIQEPHVVQEKAEERFAGLQM